MFNQTTCEVTEQVDGAADRLDSTESCLHTERVIPAGIFSLSSKEQVEQVEQVVQSASRVDPRSV